MSLLGAILAVACLATTTVSADAQLPAIFGDGMVLQRETPVPVWGWADADEEVTVTIGASQAVAKTDPSGAWKVSLAALGSPGPYKMTVSGKNTVEFKDVLVGEVWLCSGQSNMAWPMNAVMNAEEEKASANFPQIRLFNVPNRPAGTPESDVDAAWKICSPETVGDFSAVGYFFGREIQKILNVPVGLINSSWGGTRIEPWTAIVGFEMVPTLQDILTRIQQAGSQHKEALMNTVDEIEKWLPTARQIIESGQPAPEIPAWPKHPLNSHGQPTGLYNGKIHPLVPYAIRGALWYQGESNRKDGSLYTDKMKALICGWRKVWGQEELPFYFVQLAPYRYSEPHFLMPLWEAQSKVLAEIPDTGMAVTTDIVDNVADIHPRNKQDVGLRLAYWALSKTYSVRGLPTSGPLYKGMKKKGRKIQIQFDYADNGLASRDDQPLGWFEIAGEDQKFVPAQAEIDRNTVIVSSDSVKKPVAVRFGWNQEAMPNLVNKEGLPTSPFRTDSW